MHEKIRADKKMSLHASMTPLAVKQRNKRSWGVKPLGLPGSKPCSQPYVMSVRVSEAWLGLQGRRATSVRPKMQDLPPQIRQIGESIVQPKVLEF